MAHSTKLTLLSIRKIGRSDEEQSRQEEILHPQSHSMSTRSGQRTGFSSSSVQWSSISSCDIDLMPRYAVTNESMDELWVFKGNNPYPGPKPPLPTSRYTLLRNEGSSKPSCISACAKSSSVTGEEGVW